MKFRVTYAVGVVAIVGLLTVGLANSQDDWHVVERHTTATSPDAATEAPHAPGTSTKSGDASTSIECGEQARPASDEYRGIVEQLNSMWSSDFKLYESVAQMSPHASTGGCLFYNQVFLNKLLGQWMNVSDSNVTDPMVYAIFAHEMGHQLHGDTTAATKDVPQKDKELSADHVAGYSLQRLGVRRLDPDEVARYWQLTGDDFTRGGGGHGNGSERAAAFYDGWRRAEMGLPENGGRPAGGLDAP